MKGMKIYGFLFNADSYQEVAMTGRYKYVIITEVGKQAASPKDHGTSDRLIAYIE